MEATMAIALQPRFPMPDRSKISVRFAKDADGVIDVGWCDGVLSDGRAFRAEMWAQDQVSILTFFFSTSGLENCDDQQLLQLIERERLVDFADEAHCFCEGRKYNDRAGNELWSVNVVVGADRDTYVSGSVPLFPYSKAGEPNTMFNPLPIKAAHRG
jgi:hypothetical protein